MSLPVAFLQDSEIEYTVNSEGYLTLSTKCRSQRQLQELFETCVVPSQLNHFGTQFNLTTGPIISLEVSCPRFDPIYIQESNAQILAEYSDFPSVTVEILESMLRQIDARFLDHRLASLYSTVPPQLKCALSELDDTAGQLLIEGSNLTLEFSRELLSNLTPLTLSQTRDLFGRAPKNRKAVILQCLQHELVHVLIATSNDFRSDEDYEFHNTNHHGELFESLARNLFGHTTMVHSLIPNPHRFAEDSPRCSSKTRRSTRVLFRDDTGQTHQGKIHEVFATHLEITTQHGQVTPVGYDYVMPLE